MISATLVDADTYEVTLEREEDTMFTVTMSRDYYIELSAGGCTQEWVVVQAFRFLLEREPASAILRQFDLREINSYFPEFEAHMKERLADR